MRFLAGLVRPSKATLGTDFAGQVEAIGAGVSGFAVGDAVWGIDDLGLGSHAEYLVVSQDASIAKLPVGVTFDACGCLEGGWYAYSMLERSALAAGARVLVNGATGAIGSAALQLCVHFGATVTAVGNTKNLRLLESLGAERVIDHEREDFTRDQQSYDFVFDAVGKSTFGACKRLLGRGGVYVSVELGPGAQNLPLALFTPLFGGRRVVFPFPIDRKRFLELVDPLVARGTLRPVIDRRYPLEAIRDAYAYADSGQKTGCVMLDLVE
jgi:NADPH:quinone reductase-like Zn-dependent oxidoreductase